MIDPVWSLIHEAEVCVTFVNNPYSADAAVEALSQLDLGSAVSAALKVQSETDTQPTRGCHLTNSPSHIWK